MRARIVGAALAGLAACLSLYLWARTRPESTPAIRGEAAARRAGCFACHGAEGSGGVKDPGSIAGEVPGWDERTLAMYAKSGRDIRDWIVLGRPPGAGTAREGGSIPMPAYGGILAEREIDDITAYVQAVSGWDPQAPDAAYEGRKAAKELGCFGCHGASGIGGVPNPGSLTGAIPSWTGEDYPELVRGEAELREWVLEGRPERLAKDPRARLFLDRARIRMPAYRGRVSDDDMEKLAAYIRRLRS